MHQSYYGIEDFFEFRIPLRGRKQPKLHCKLCDKHKQHHNGDKANHLLAEHFDALTACQIQECEDDLENARAKRRMDYGSSNVTASSACEWISDIETLHS